MMAWIESDSEVKAEAARRVTSRYRDTESAPRGDAKWIDGCGIYTESDFPSSVTYEPMPYILDIAEGIDPRDAKIEDLEARVEKLEALLLDTANQLARFAQSHVEMQQKLIASGAFEKRSSIIMPGRGN